MSNEDIDFQLNQFVGQTTQPLVVALRPAIFDEEVRAFEPTEITQPCHDAVYARGAAWLAGKPLQMPA
jgi:hypothetical protein